MTITTKTENSRTILAFQGRLDTSSFTQAQADIGRLLEGKDVSGGLVCDLSLLEYISSSGLRILLSLAKRCQDFCVVEASEQVYGVLEVTGFTKMMRIEKALRSISIDGCDIIGRGGVGTVYRLDDETIIKVFGPGMTLDQVRSEITMAKAAFVLGMPTAISFDVVRVGDQLGLVYELLHADTLSMCVRKEPQRMEHFARLYARLFRQLHAIEVPVTDGDFPSAQTLIEQSVKSISRYFDVAATDMMMRIAEAIPPGNRLLHGDLQSKNAMLQGEELMLIDMGEVAYGHPLIDLAHSYSPMVSLVGDYEAIVGLPKELANELWRRMIDYYFEDEPKDVVAHRLEQIEVVSFLRNVAWLSLSDSIPEKAIKQCREKFDARVMKRKDYIVSVCNTLKDYTL